MDRHNMKLKLLYKCTMTNTSAIWQQAAHTTHQLSSPSCPTRAIQKSLSLNKKDLGVFWQKASSVPRHTTSVVAELRKPEFPERKTGN